MGKIVAVNTSAQKGIRKEPATECVVRANCGLDGDAHSGPESHRQVSLLALESIEKMQQEGYDVRPGDFAENLTTQDIALLSLPVGTLLTAGDGVLLEISQVGKECHADCAIMRQVGKCVMPAEGVFAKVLAGGTVKPGDSIGVEGKSSESF